MKKGQTVTIPISLISQANSPNFQSAPTLEVGDVTISKDHGAENNIATLPVVSPAGSVNVKLTIGTAEMTADTIKVNFKDVSGGVWEGLSVTILTNTNDVDDLALASIVTESRLAELDAANLPTDINSVLTDTNNIEIQLGTAGAGLTNLGGMSTNMKNEVNAEADTALSDYAGPKKTEMTSEHTALNTNINGNETKIDAVKVDTAAILLDTGTDGVVIADKTGFALSSAGVDAILDEVVEGAFTMRQILRIAFSVLAGLSSGGGTTNIKFRDNADGKDRIDATVDDNGNRIAITIDGT